MVRLWFKLLENHLEQNLGDLADAFNTSVFSHFNQNCPRVDVVFDRYGKTYIMSGYAVKTRGANAFNPSQD